MNYQNFIVLLLALGVLLLADLAKYHGMKVREVIFKCNILIRWPIILTGIAAVILFGVWGSGYEAVNFIYFQF